MFCPNCGSNNPDNASHCSNCGISLGAQPAEQTVPVSAPKPAAATGFKDYMMFNIIMCVVSFLCAGGCLGIILSVIGIIFGSKAKTSYAAGNIAEAESQAKIAKIMAIVTVVVAVIGLIATGILLLVYGASFAALIASEMGMMLAL